MPPRADPTTTEEVIVIFGEDFDGHTSPPRTFPIGTNLSVIENVIKNNPGGGKVIGNLPNVVANPPPEIKPFLEDRNRNQGIPDLSKAVRDARRAAEAERDFNQVVGAIKAGLGVAGVAGGVFLLASNPIGWGVAIVGGGGILLGLDEAQAGIRQSVSGENTNTLTNEGLQAAGLTQEQANWAELGLGLGLAGGEIITIVKLAKTREAAELALKEAARLKEVARIAQSAAADAAFTGMPNGGGHAIRYMQGQLISNTGSLSSRLSQFAQMAKPILMNPITKVPWRVGETHGTLYLGKVGGRYVAIVIANSGDYAGKVFASFFPDPDQLLIIIGR